MLENACSHANVMLRNVTAKANDEDSYCLRTSDGLQSATYIQWLRNCVLLPSVQPPFMHAVVNP